MAVPSDETASPLFLFPSCAIFSSLASLQETTAISAQANTALTAINTTCKRILPTMSLSKRFKPPHILH